MMPRPPLSLPIATQLFEDFQKLNCDYWILEGAFSQNALFVTGSVVVQSRDFPEMEQAAFALIRDLTEKPTDPSTDSPKEKAVITGPDLRLYKDLHDAMTFKKAHLTALRIKLEGPMWHNYDADVQYQIIGNQPNPGQKGTAAPRNRKSTRLIKATRNSASASTMVSTSTFKSDSFKSEKDRGADGFPALGAANTRGMTSNSAHSSGSFTIRVPSPLATTPVAGPSSPSPFAALSVATGLVTHAQEIAQLKQKHRQATQSYIASLSMQENEMVALENEVSELRTSSDQLRATITARDATITRQLTLMEKYRMALIPTGVQIDHDNGEIALGSIGKRGFEESWEDDRVQDLKKRKLSLQEDVDELLVKKSKLAAEVTKSKGKWKALDQGPAQSLAHGEVLEEEL